MKQQILIKNALIINEHQRLERDILINDGIIEEIATSISAKDTMKIIDAKGNVTIPGIIDDQVHFREPGLTHKGSLATESKAAVAGGITSFMEMPNTGIQTLTQDLLEKKYLLGKEKSLANYSFYMGVSNSNVEEVLKTDKNNVCGIKIFMGSSTGNMLVDNEETLHHVFKNSPLLIATHCEKESIITANEEKYKEQYGDDISFMYHKDIRSKEACIESSKMALSLAKEHNSRLHILHISTEDECLLFDNTTPLEEKRITAEACAHHLFFNAQDYIELKSKIKCNPAIKEKNHQEGLWHALQNNLLDVIATDHAPHTWQEKDNCYWKSPSGIPLVQHSFQMVYEQCLQRNLPLEFIVEKMCHNPAKIFNIEKRGFLREGYWADICIIDINQSQIITPDSLLYKCQWSPVVNSTFSSSIKHTIVSGNHVYDNGIINEEFKGQRLAFNRD